MTTNSHDDNQGRTADADQTPANMDALSHSFEDHLYQLIIAAEQSEDPKQTKAVLDIVRNSIKSRLEVIVAGKEFVKLMLSGNAAAFLLLIAFIYEHKAISTDFFLTKFLVVISSIALLGALFLTFGQFARYSAQEQIQKWRIALAHAENWHMLVQTWHEARSNPTTKRLFSAQQTVSLEFMILMLWAVGGASVIFAWVLSFF